MSKQTGAYLLSAWIEETGRKLKWVAGQLGVEGATLTKWLDGRTYPQRSNRMSIETLTGGAVPVSAWEVEGE